MITRLNIIDRIILPILLLTSLYILINSYFVGHSSIDNPIIAQWVLAVVGFVYVLYQAIRIGSPFITVLSSIIVLVGCYGPVIVHIVYYWQNTIWLPLGRGVGAIIASIFVLAISGLPAIIMTYIAWIVLRKRKKAVAEFALQMLREDKKINICKLAQQFNISEINARTYIADFQKKSVIPFKVEIV